MCGFRPGRLVLALLCVFTFSGLAFSADAALVSTMRNVNAVMEAQGFRINPAFEHSGFTIEGDLAPVQAFEIMRPDGKAFSIGRLYTSCTCIQLESPKKSFAEGERAILQLRNIRPTPTNGQIYAIYVQIKGPVNTTLRYDTFVQSNNPELMAAAGLSARTDASAASDDLDEVTPPPAVADAPEPAMPQTQTSTGQGFQVIVPGEEPEQPEEETIDELATPEQPAVETADEPAAPAEQPAVETPAESDDIISQFDAIAAEAEARVQAASAAASSMAADMDDYFAEMDSAAPQPLPPPAETEVLPPAPAAPVAVMPAAPAAPVTGTRLEEAVHTASTTPSTAASQDDALPVTGKKPLKNISLITIGVRDLDRSIRFYRALGWEMAPRSKYDQTAFFQLNGQVLVLYPMPELLREQNMESARPSPGGITLAIHVSNKNEVVETYKTFIEAGGISLKEPTETLAGSVTSYVADPDGNAWEISYVSQFKVDENGWLWLNQK